MKNLIIEEKEGYIAKQLKDKSVCIELKMIIDNGEDIAPFVRMFCLDDFRDMNYDKIEEIILEGSSQIAKRFCLALLHRPDCLNGNEK